MVSQPILAVKYRNVLKKSNKITKYYANYQFIIIFAAKISFQPLQSRPAGLICADNAHGNSATAEG